MLESKALPEELKENLSGVDRIYYARDLVAALFKDVVQDEDVVIKPNAPTFMFAGKKAGVCCKKGKKPPSFFKSE